MPISSSISALAQTLDQWVTIKRRNAGYAAMLKIGVSDPASSEPTVITFDGFHGWPSRCHLVHRRYGERILVAFGHIENTGTSPTNMVEELASAVRLRFYPKDRFDRIEWFDAWPEHYSLTDRFHIQRVHFGDPKSGAGLAWVPISRDVPTEFVKEVRQVINVQPGLPLAA